ncbi:hypothetical protein ACJJTC_014848 [Scirpophaga incertulas]
MLSLKSIILVVAAFALQAECSGVPAVAAAPLLAPAAVGYSQAIPQNVPPFASQVNVVNRAFSSLIATPAIAAAFAAAPVAAPLSAPLTAPVAAPLTAPVSAPYAASFAAIAAPVAARVSVPIGSPLTAPYASYITGPAPVIPAAPAAYATSFPYSSSLVRSPYLASAFLR